MVLTDDSEFFAVMVSRVLACLFLGGIATKLFWKALASQTGPQRLGYAMKEYSGSKYTFLYLLLLWHLVEEES
jgi:hypothetical protein